MNNENLNATLRCVTRPSAAQEEKIKTFLKNKYQAENITLTISIDPSVRGGFILSANNDEYDWSTRSRQQQLQEQIQAARDKAIQMKKDGTLMSILKEAIEQFEATSQENEVGYVETIGDGIATISGLDHAMYGEVVVFENGTKGMVLDITTENIGVILFDTEGTIGQGTKVSRTKKQAGMTVSSNFLGRWIHLEIQLMDLVLLKPLKCVLSKNPHQALLTVNLSQLLWKPVFYPSILCSLLEEDSVN